MFNILAQLVDGLPADATLEDCILTTSENVGEDNYIGDVVIVVLPGFVADDGNAKIEYPNAATAEEAADEYVSDGDWGDCSSTSWVDVSAWQVGYYLDDDGDITTIQLNEDSFHIELDAVEPDCVSGNTHEWKEVDGSLQGHGGGVTFRSYCTHCGIYCDTDTWAQDAGVEGLRSESYSDGDDDSSLLILRNALQHDYESISSDNDDSHDWIVEILTGVDVSNGYSSVMECEGYSIPADVNDIIYDIHKYMLYYLAALALKDYSIDWDTNNGGMFFTPNNISIADAQQLAGSKYTIAKAVGDVYTITMIDM